MAISAFLDASNGRGQAAQQPPPSPPTTGSSPAPLPTIVPNRRRLDKRFPVLAFTIRTFGLPYFEVLLTTDRALFDSAHATQRNPTNFYAGRQDGGLIRSVAQDTAYVVPAVALHRFADARPRPNEIFYTVAAYATPESPPVLAHPASVLSVIAPSVLLGGDFQTSTLASILAVPVHKLQTVSDPSLAEWSAAVPVSDGTDPELDDDGIPLAEARSWSSAEEDDTKVDYAAQADDGWVDDHSDTLTVDETDTGSYDDEAFDSPVAGWAADDGDTEQGWQDDEQLPADDQETDAFSYDDGYDDDPHEQPAWSQATESVFPVGAAEPATLPDDEQGMDDDFGYAEAVAAPYEAEPDYRGFANGTSSPDEQAPQYAHRNGSVQTSPVVAPRELDIPAKIAIVTKIGRMFESPDGFRGISPDAEFSDPALRQRRSWHTGLKYGFVGFTQDSGMLGRLLRMMRDRDPGRFHDVFGSEADELVRVTTLPGPSSRTAPGERSARLQPIAGHDIWTEPWLSRFRAAGDYPPFQAAQNELAVRSYLDPMLGFAAGYGLDTERALAMLADRAVQLGVGEARRWLTAAIGPIRTDAQRQQALGALGFPGVREFQQNGGLRVDGHFGPTTHAAMVAALRRLGPAAPIPIPTREQLMDAIVARADGDQLPWRRRPQTIRTSPEFGDAPLSWTSPAPTAR